MTSIPRAANPAAGPVRLSFAGLLIAGLAIAACGEGPHAAFAQQTQPAEPTIRAYRVPQEQLDSVANQLRSQWAGRADVRVASDPRSGQIIVQGPPDVQQSVAARLAQIQRPPATGGARADNPPLQGSGTAAPRAGTPASRTATASSVVQLRHHAAREIEESLLGLFGQRLTAAQSRELGATSYLLNGNVRIDVQQQTNRVTLSGPTGAVDGLTRLIQAWDTPDAGPERITRTVAMERSSPNTAQRLADAGADGYRTLSARRRIGNAPRERAGRSRRQRCSTRRRQSTPTATPTATRRSQRQRARATGTTSGRHGAAGRRNDRPGAGGNA